jgi:hypothetical protein
MIEPLTWDKIIIPLIASLIGAIIGAVMAFRYQRKIEILREKRGLMQMLMAYRSIGAVEVDWIKALNMIDIVFHNSKRVKELLRKYMYYTDISRFHTGEHAKVLVELIYEMGQLCGYTDLKESDIRDSYNPRALNHIYGSVLDRMSHEATISEPPPSTNPEKTDKGERSS